MPVIAGAVGDLFDLIHRGDGIVALFALGTQGYLTTAPSWIGAWQQAIGEAELFSMIDVGEGRVAFRLSNGAHYLSAPAGDRVMLTADATTIGPSEQFLVEVFDLSKLPPGKPGCCNSWSRPEDPEDPDVFWDDKTHEEIMKTAIIGMRRAEIQNDETRRLFGSFWARAEFQKQAQKGLEDADYEAPWRGATIYDNPGDPRKSIFTWHDHFYNPETGLNYMQVARMKTGALTEGRRCFNLSVYAGMRALKFGGLHGASALHAQAGYYLGLSLHFLTDLTQPMHAANFTNVFGEDGNYPTPVPPLARHSGFETYAEILVKNRGYFANYSTLYPMTSADVATADVVDVTSLLHQVAKTHHAVFKSKVMAHVRAMKGNTWGDEAEPALEDSLRKAPKVVARYLAYWARCVNQTWDDIDPGYYYRIVEPTKGEWICWQGGQYRRGTVGDGQDLMFFIFNDDGTWSIGCQAQKGSIWCVTPGPGGDWIGEYRRGGTTPKNARFRFVRNDAPGRKDDVWIYDANKDQPVVVNKAYPDQIGVLMRWPGNVPGQDLFLLKKMERITLGDLEEIVAIWPDFHLFPWHGMSRTWSPEVTNLPVVSAPNPPAGMFIACFVGPASPRPDVASPDCPVLQWGDLTYWPYSFADDRIAMGIVGYDKAKNICHTVEALGARFIWKITVDPDARTATFWGQSNKNIVLAWESLLSQPVTAHVARTGSPSIPTGMVIGCHIGPNSPQPDGPSPDCPVIHWGDLTYWPFDFLDAHEAMGIVAYDKAKNICRIVEAPGVRHIWKITVESNAKTVTFWGQNNKKAVLSWKVLQVAPVVARLPRSSSPPRPPGMALSGHVGPNSPQPDGPSTDCPVIQWGGLTFWLYDFRDSRLTTGIVAFDSAQNICHTVQAYGTRYIWKLTVEQNDGTITIWGQNSAKTVVKWDVLRPRGPMPWLA